MNYSKKTIILKFFLTFVASMTVGIVLIWSNFLDLVFGRDVVPGTGVIYLLFVVSLLFALVLSLFYVISEKKKITKEKRLKDFKKE